MILHRSAAKGNSNLKKSLDNISYSIIDGADKMDISEVMALLAQTYWADKRPIETVKSSMEHSCCYGVYLTDEQKLVGFARVISDFATTYYLCDVVVDEVYRGRGLGEVLVSYIENLDEYKDLRGVLITRDAHSLYEKFGYKTLDGRAMVKGLNC